MQLPDCQLHFPLVFTHYFAEFRFWFGLQRLSCDPSLAVDVGCFCWPIPFHSPRCDSDHPIKSENSPVLPHPSPPPNSLRPLAPHLSCQCIVSRLASLRSASLRPTVSGLVTGSLRSSHTNWALPRGPGLGPGPRLRPGPGHEAMAPSDSEDAIERKVNKEVYSSSGFTADSFRGFQNRLVDRGVLNDKQLEQHHDNIRRLYRVWQTSLPAQPSERDERLPMGPQTPESLPPLAALPKNFTGSSGDARMATAVETVKEAVASIIPDVSHNNPPSQ